MCALTLYFEPPITLALYLLTYDEPTHIVLSARALVNSSSYHLPQPVRANQREFHDVPARRRSYELHHLIEHTGLRRDRLLEGRAFLLQGSEFPLVVEQHSLVSCRLRLLLRYPLPW